MKKRNILRLGAVSGFVLLALGIMSGGGAAALDRETLPGPAVGDAASVFVAKCALCHGKDGHGLPAWKSKGQPDFTDAQWQKTHTDAQIVETIKNGKGKYMPPFKGKLSEQEITLVVSRVRWFGKK